MDELSSFWQQLKNVPVPPNLNKQIILRLQEQQKRQRFLQALLYLAAALTLFLTLLTFNLLKTDWQTTAGWQMLKLSISDPQLVLQSFKNWVLAVAETVPIGSLTAFFGAFFLLLATLNKLIKNLTFKKVF